MKRLVAAAAVAFAILSGAGAGMLPATDRVFTVFYDFWGNSAPTANTVFEAASAPTANSVFAANTVFAADTADSEDSEDSAKAAAAADAADEIIDGYVKSYGDEIESGISSLDGAETEKAVPGFSAGEILSGLANGENVFSVREICSRGAALLAGEVRDTLKLMVLILALSVMSTYLVNMQSSFGGEGAADAAFFVCYAVTAGAAAAAFAEVVGCAAKAVENITLFMQTLVPLVLAGLAASGAAVTATAFETALISVIEITQWAIDSIFIPLLMIAAGVNIVNNLSDKLKADKMAELLNKTVKWGLSIMLTLFVGITGLQGIAAGSADGLTVKVTKFAASNLIPVVGGILAESVETVMNCSVVIKNAVGLTGITVVAVIAAVPLMKIAACLLVFRISAAAVQPIADKRIVKCISELADSVSCALSMVAAVSVMFVIILTLIINIGNSALMLGR